jgi:hypothetical protein
MDESTWNACTDACGMLTFLKKDRKELATHRKLRLFILACFREYGSASGLCKHPGFDLLDEKADAAADDYTDESSADLTDAMGRARQREALGGQGKAGEAAFRLASYVRESDPLPCACDVAMDSRCSWNGQADVLRQIIKPVLPSRLPTDWNGFESVRQAAVDLHTWQSPIHGRPPTGKMKNALYEHGFAYLRPYFDSPFHKGHWLVDLILGGD